MNSLSRFKNLPTTTQMHTTDVRDDTLAIGEGPYASQQELIDHHLSAIRRRLRIARQHYDHASEHDRAAHRGFDDVILAEANLDARVRATRKMFPLSLLRERFALTLTEERVLWLLIAYEVCPVARQRIRELVTEHVWDPTFDVIRRVVYGTRYGSDVWDELGPSGTLRRFNLMERTDHGELPDYRTTWRIPARLHALLYNDLGLDPQLWELGSIVRDAREVEELEVSGDALHQLELGFDRGDVVLAHGASGSGRRASLRAIAQRRNLSVLEIDCRLIADERVGAQQQVTRIARECQLLGLTPLLRHFDALAGDSGTEDRIDLVGPALPRPILATSARPIVRRWMQRPVCVELRPITVPQRARLWHRVMPSTDRQDAEILATMHPIAPALIETAGRQTVRRCGSAELEQAFVADGVHAALCDRFSGFAKPVPCTQSWEELILREDQMAQVEDLLGRMREHTSRYIEREAVEEAPAPGLSILFSGAEGTGKTTTAACLARALRLDLFQADFDRIISSRDRETERNIALVFDAAEAGRVLLVLDNIDSVCADYTSVQAEYLVRRIESYGGLCVLTARNEIALDPRLRKRMSVHIPFPEPGLRERERLWRSMVPESTRDLGLDALAASYDLTGGHIRNAVLRAQRVAAAEGVSIDGKQLARAAIVEYAALGKRVSPKR